MIIEDLQEFIALVGEFQTATSCHGTHVMTDAEIEQDIKDSKDLLGQFTLKLRPSEMLKMKKFYRKWKAAIETAQLEGKNEL